MYREEAKMGHVNAHTETSESRVVTHSRDFGLEVLRGKKRIVSEDYKDDW